MEGLVNDVTHLVKFVLLGDIGVGKSSIMNRFMNNEFDKNISPSLGSEFHTHTFTCSRSFKVQFWDTAGGLKHANNRQIYYLGASIFFIVYDMCDSRALKQVLNLLEEIRWKKDEELNAFSTEFKAGAMVCLVANKSDMKHMRQISEADGLEFAQEYNLHYFEMSAKTGQDVKASFEAALLAFDAMDADNRKTGGTGLTHILDYPPSEDFEYESSENDVWIEYNGRRNKCCCILL
jgi:small GTP-binding protein